ncbi:MAG: nucleotidyltransferase family protein [Bacillota bacterium]
MNERYRELLINPDLPLREALRQMDKGALQLLIVVDKQDKILGVVTDGDIRRAIIKNVDFNDPIKMVMNTSPITLSLPINKKKAFKMMQKSLIKHIPVVNDQGQVVDILLWNTLIESGQELYPCKDNPVVIMAGGKGTRLDPFTKILPKPLIPVGDKPIIEIIMDRFNRYGFNNFVISLNYKAEMIKMYFSENPNGYQIDYIQEKEFLGTAGALALAKEKLQKTFILSNCDVVTDADFDNFLNYHLENKNHATVFAVVRHMKIPYGVMKINNGDLEDILEKPEYSFVINTGIYVLEPGMIDLIPEGTVMNMPDLLMIAKEKGFKVQVCPMSCSWFDVGEWEEYRKALDFISGNRCS